MKNNEIFELISISLGSEKSRAPKCIVTCLALCFIIWLMWDFFTYCISIYFFSVKVKFYCLFILINIFLIVYLLWYLNILRTQVTYELCIPQRTEFWELWTMTLYYIWNELWMCVTTDWTTVGLYGVYRALIFLYQSRVLDDLFWC